MICEKTVFEAEQQLRSWRREAELRYEHTMAVHLARQAPGHSRHIWSFRRIVARMFRHTASEPLGDPPTTLERPAAMRP